MTPRSAVCFTKRPACLIAQITRGRVQRLAPLGVDAEALSWFGRLTSFLSLRHQVHDLVMRAEFEAFFVAHKRERILDLREKLRRRIDCPFAALMNRLQLFPSPRQRTAMTPPQDAVKVPSGYYSLLSLLSAQGNFFDVLILLVVHMRSF